MNAAIYLFSFTLDHPFQVIVGLGIPLAGKILYDQLQVPHLTVSQRIMHSRVVSFRLKYQILSTRLFLQMAQAGVLSILLSTMAFKEYMDKHGRYVD